MDFRYCYIIRSIRKRHAINIENGDDAIRFILIIWFRLLSDMQHIKNQADELIHEPRDKSDQPGLLFIKRSKRQLRIKKSSNVVTLSLVFRCLETLGVLYPGIDRISYSWNLVADNCFHFQCPASWFHSC